MGAGAGVDLRTRSKQMSSVEWVVVTSAADWMTNSRCGARRSTVTVGRVFRRVNEATHKVFIMHMGEDINFVFKTSQDFDQDKKDRNIQLRKDNENETTSSHNIHTPTRHWCWAISRLDVLMHFQDSNMQSQYRLRLKDANKDTHAQGH